MTPGPPDPEPAGQPAVSAGHRGLLGLPGFCESWPGDWVSDSGFAQQTPEQRSIGCDEAPGQNRSALHCSRPILAGTGPPSRRGRRGLSATRSRARELLADAGAYLPLAHAAAIYADISRARSIQQWPRPANADLLGNPPLPMERIMKSVTGSGGLCVRARKAYSKNRAPDPGKYARVIQRSHQQGVRIFFSPTRTCASERYSADGRNLLIALYSARPTTAYLY